MSATSTTKDRNPQTTSPPAFVITPESLKYIVTHVFLPVQLPGENDYTPENNRALARAVSAAAHAYSTHVCGTSEQAQWHRITKMLDNLQVSVQSEHLDSEHVVSQLREMQAGDILAFFIQHQNAAILLTKCEDRTLCEAFEVSPSEGSIKLTEEPLIRSYPGSSVKVSNDVLDDRDFQFELAKFISHVNATDSDLPLPPPAHPRYVNILLDSIVQSVGHATDTPRSRKRAVIFAGLLRRLGLTAEVSRITKHVRDYVDDWQKTNGAIWRRSPLWLLIRVAIQMSVNRTLGCASYKQFVLFFMCTLAMDGNNTSLSSDLLYLMSCRNLQRLGKLGPSTPVWLSEIALGTCTRLREVLDARWNELNARPSPFRNPSQDELTRDTELSLLNAREYIHNALENHAHRSAHAPFSPSHRRRGAIEDFLSSNGTFFDEAYGADPDVTLYDVERSVEQGIDDWLACITNVDEACAQLEILMDKYMTKTQKRRYRDPECLSVTLLTGIELYVAIDKLAVKEIPMLADYPPEIPIAGLERLFLRKATSLHRLSCAYQYLSARCSQSHLGWSVLADEFTEDSFPVRYYDQSLRLQQLNTRIREDAHWREAGHGSQERRGADLIRADDGHEEHQEGKQASKSPLPTSPLHAKVVTFELQCPACIRVWRSAAARILQGFYFLMFNYDKLGRKEGYDLLADVPALQRYLVERREPLLRWQVHLAYVYPPQVRDRPMLRYVVQYPQYDKQKCFSIWKPNMYDKLEEGNRSYHFRYRSEELGKYVNSTSHTCNDVLAAQSDCPADLSLDEFIAFALLRSGGSLQWLNILHGLRSRTLNFRRHCVHYLLASAAFQVGPLDINTGVWVWHQELQDSSFCVSLLNELDSLFVELGVALIDGVLMGTISLLLTRMLSSSPSEDISQRAIALLRRVRRKTFGWLRELSYDLAMTPTNEERRTFLLEIAAICRSTFDIDPVAFHKLFRSAEDVDALLSGAFFIHALHPAIGYGYLGLLLYRDRCLSPALEEISRDIILADPSDYGIDHAVCKIFATYQLGTQRWEQLQHPNARWLTCETNATVDRPSQTVHINLLNGILRVDGRPSGGLPHKVWHSPEFRKISRDQGFFVVPSNLPGMDSVVLSMTSEHKIHFSLQDDNLVIRVPGNQMNEILELIPSRKLRGDLPQALIDGHIHWLNLSTKNIEIRPLKQVWEQSSEHWRMDCASGQYRAYRGHEMIVDVRSPTCAMVSKCFECLLNTVNGDLPRRKSSDNKDLHNEATNLLITTSPVDSLQPASMLQLSVTLPRHGLTFFVNETKELESHDFKDMVYDEDQSVGALFGLENLLVLRPKIHLAGCLIPEALIPRRVIIPNGYPKMHDNHQVRIDTAGARYNKELYYTYNVDTELGCLTGDGTLRSTRLLTYVHAMTNCHRPDPLTGKTGAQAALCLLQSAGCRSITKLQAFDSDESFWITTQYPQLNIAYQEIRNRYYWDPYRTIKEIGGRERHAARRATHLFPSNITGPISPGDLGYNEDNYLTTRVPAEPRPTGPSHTVSLRHIPNTSSPTQITLDHLIVNRPAPELPGRSTLLHDIQTTSSEDIPALDQLFSALHTDSSFQQQYLAHLDASTQHYHMEPRTTHRVAGENLVDALKKHYVQCRGNYLDSLDRLKKSLGPTADPYDEALNLSCQWPPITADVLLGCLASTSPIEIHSRWKKCLTSLALLLLDLQRARRLLRFALDGLQEEFSKELENEGCDGWSPEEYPDWLLIQIQGNFLIRRTQVETAMEIMTPQHDENTVLQVNMGEGKSSVIIPIAAAALADGKQLVRVIVPRALTVQIFELLVARLGRLTNRPIYHLPFSRAPEYNSVGRIISLQIDDLHKFLSQCIAERGIVLVQPEHVVSLKLMSVEEQTCASEGNATTDPSTEPQTSIYGRIKTAMSFQSDSASKWLSLQKWLYSHARDILDESDEILYPRFQLVYTIGYQQHMDGYPERWKITQQVLRLVKKHVHSLSRYAPESIEYERDSPPGSFPHVRILRACNVKPRLISLIVEDVMAGQLANMNFQHVPTAIRDASRSFISDEGVFQDTARGVEEYAKGSGQNHIWGGLLLLRGLLTSNILFVALAERRWRVDYGPALQSQSRRYGRDKAPQSHTMLAVPYRAKDVPAPNTQFGHPDLTIVLTCLSYYYAGLSKEQLRLSFEILQDQDDPTAEYSLWIRDCEPVPDSLQKPTDINVRSSEQWDNSVFPFFSRNQAVIDFYLSRVVFPKEAKEFPQKLSGSSWDLAEKRERLITGFSGTNDGRWLMPLSMGQRDLEHQRGTSARVLAHLLRPENAFYKVTHDGDQRWSTNAFLRMVAKQEHEIRVLLDVGSQILDLSNHEVATEWLKISRDTAGAIYFSEDDELMVLTRNGKTLSLRSSSLSQQLDRCVVYLDHAHTRGTDLKLPIGSRAAVTLGPKVTKDALVQGCMRMRKLGHGHSVMFFSPPEVDHTIRVVTAKANPSTPVTTVDVLCWAIHETWTDIQQRAPYWAKQGMDHKSRYDAWLQFINGKLSRKKLKDAWLQPEFKTLADLYAPCATKNTPSDLSTLDPRIRERCKDLGILSLPSAQLDEEREREVNRQREREREVELPPRATPAEHRLHPAVSMFVKTGVILPFSAFRPVFTTLKKTHPAIHEADIWSPKVLATADFCKTIKSMSTRGTVDQYRRPVQWVLSRNDNRDQVLVLLSPFEVNRLMPDIRASTHVHLHVYAPRTTQRMKPSDDLKLYSIPPLPSDWTPPWALVDQLNVFAGQLYLRDYDAYVRLCRLFGVPATKESRNDRAIKRNLFGIRDRPKKNEITHFINGVLAMRTRGLPFAESHMGRILQRQYLIEKDFQR